MEKQQYLDTVTEHIRYEKARKYVAEELENHIEDQKEVFMLSGMNEESSFEKAVEEMGDPVEVGVLMDQIHRPKMEWKMMLLVLLISIMGIVFQYVIMTDMGSLMYPYRFDSQILYVFIGFCTMFFFCYFDYTRIGKYCKIGAAVLLALLLYSVLFGSRINGRFGYLMFLGKSINLHLLMYLYIPFFGGILYFYRTKGKNGLFRVILWMLAPIILILRLPDLSLASALLMIMLLQGCYVMKKGWFNCGKKGMITMFSAVLALPVFMLLYFLFFGASYQRARIIAIFNMSNFNDINYQMNMARNILLESQFVGKSVEGVTEILPEVPSHFIITYIFSYYGVLVAGIVISFLVLFIIKNFKISISQKNQLGLVVGLGCSLVFAAQIIMYIMVNLTILPPTTVFLPFFSYGGTGAIVSFALIGILLSIYRYQNILPTAPKFQTSSTAR